MFISILFPFRILYSLESTLSTIHFAFTRKAALIHVAFVLQVVILHYTNFSKRLIYRPSIYSSLLINSCSLSLFSHACHSLCAISSHIFFLPTCTCFSHNETLERVCAFCGVNSSIEISPCLPLPHSFSPSQFILLLQVFLWPAMPGVHTFESGSLALQGLGDLVGVTVDRVS